MVIKIPGISGRYHSLRWALRQLLPLKYASGYVHHAEDGKNLAYFSEWRMWLGSIYQHRRVFLGEVIEA